MLEFSTQPADRGIRLDKLVASKYPQYTRSSLALLFDKQMVLVNQKPSKGSYKVKPADAISVDETYLNKQPEPVNLAIIYEDDDVMVIDKPAGVLTHSKGALNLEPSVASFIKSKITDPNLAGNRAGIIHRLDRPTSGVLITAKHQAALAWLQKQFSERKVNKTYAAITEGAFDPKAAIIDAPIARNPNKPQTFSIMPNGKPAITKYQVKTELNRNGKPYSVVELKPQTGRTHQLRVHLAYTGHPILGDAIYGRSGDSMYLHAEQLDVILPNKTKATFHSELPPKFKEFMTNG